MDRRTFLSASAAGIALTQVTNSAVAQTPSASIKDPALKLITADPLVLETPDHLLSASRITPSSALFVRNHHGAKHLEDMKPRELTGQLSLSGLIDKPISYPMADLAKLPKTEVEMVLQCSGNFRYQFSKLSPIKGTPWNKGGIGNVRFGGVGISDFLKAVGVTLSKQAKYLTVEAADQPEKEGQVDYEKSVPLYVAIERGLLATELNGVALPAVHGGPLRLVIPGYYGNVQVKWLTGMRFEANETTNFYQIPDYRTPKQRIEPGQAIEYTFDNSDPNFDMKINSRIFAPVDGGMVAAGQKIDLRGVAWNDGAAELVAVEISQDSGATWSSTQLGPSAGPYAFREWTSVAKFGKGEHSLWVRAMDALGRTQPLDGRLFWESRWIRLERDRKNPSDRSLEPAGKSSSKPAKVAGTLRVPSAGVYLK